MEITFSHLPVAEIDRQRTRGWKDFHAERYCHNCGSRNIWSWAANNADWDAVEKYLNEVLGKRINILCPQCFTEVWAAATGKQCTWRLTPMEDTIHDAD